MDSSNPAEGVHAKQGAGQCGGAPHMPGLKHSDRELVLAPLRCPRQPSLMQARNGGPGSRHLLAGLARGGLRGRLLAARLPGRLVLRQQLLVVRHRLLKRLLELLRPCAQAHAHISLSPGGVGHPCPHVHAHTSLIPEQQHACMPAGRLRPAHGARVAAGARCRALTLYAGKADAEQLGLLLLVGKVHGGVDPGLLAAAVLLQLGARHHCMPT